MWETQSQSSTKYATRGNYANPTKLHTTYLIQFRFIDRSYNEEKYKGITEMLYKTTSL